MKCPVSEPMHIPEKRSNTVSGLPLSSIRIPQQESRSNEPVRIKIGYHNAQEESHATNNCQPIEENEGQDDGAKTTSEQASQNSDMAESPTPSRKKRSRNSSERFVTHSHHTSRSGSRSPSVHTALSAFSVNTSAYHSTSDLSSASSVNVPSTEIERNYILMSKMLDVIKSPTVTSTGILKTVDSDTVSESGDEHNPPLNQVASLEEKETKRCKRSSTIGSGSDNTLESSHDPEGMQYKLEPYNYSCILVVNLNNS